MRAVKVAAGQGDARDVLGSSDTVKLMAGQSGGALGLVEWEETRGSGPPLHVHSREDEGYYVLEGEVTFFVGDEVVFAPRGTFLFAPRGVPHSWRVESEAAAALQMIVPGGFESFFLETFPAASDSGPKDVGLDQIADAAAKFGVTILGPQPGSDGAG